VISQCNNAFIFPGLTLGLISIEASNITDNISMKAAITLAKYGFASQGIG